MESIDKRVYSLEVIEFTRVANEFCSQMEKAKEYTGLQILKILQMVIPLLYIKAVALPGVEPVLEEGTEKFVSEDDWKRIHDPILARLGEANDFPEVFDSRATDDDQVFYGSIAEYVADIYQDLKDFLTGYHVGTTELMNDYIWECTESFRLYWGQKLVNTLRAVHSALGAPEKVGESGIDKDGEESIDTSDWIISRKMDDFRKGDDEEI